MGLLEGDNALITGAASGIGRGIAKALVAEGVRPVLSDVAVEAGRALAREMNATFIAADLADPTAPVDCSMPQRKRSGSSQSWYIVRRQGGEPTDWSDRMFGQEGKN
jgi:NAD(P)-dependent dehydrogenase (short-subunit alcohol dehydrogenase family)